MRKPNNRIPIQARFQILSFLRENYRIPTETMLDIIACYVPFNRRDAQQRAYWLDKCQQLMSSIRDTEGRRMVFNIPKHQSIHKCSEYIMVGACTDPQELAVIQYRLNGSIVGLQESEKVIEDQKAFLQSLRSHIDSRMFTLED